MLILNYYKNYSKILLNYTLFFILNLKIYNNENYVINLYIKGLNMIKTIYFSNLNKYKSFLELYNVCDKSYIYYIEFINQILNNNSNIENMNDNNLTLNDAIFFCYKKLLNNEFNMYNNYDNYKNIDKILNILNNYYFILYIDKIYNYIIINRIYIDSKIINNIDINKFINEHLNDHNKLIYNSILKNKKNLISIDKIENINNYLFDKSAINTNTYNNNKHNSINNYYNINELNNNNTINNYNNINELNTKMLYMNNEIIKSIKEINYDINKL